MKEIGKIYKATGDVVPFTIAGESASLKEMQAAVGGYIERVRLSAPVKGLGDCIMVVNEEGLIHKLPINLQASMLAQRHIVGDAIVMPKEYFR